MDAVGYEADGEDSEDSRGGSPTGQEEMVEGGSKRSAHCICVERASLIHKHLFGHTLYGSIDRAAKNGSCAVLHCIGQGGRGLGPVYTLSLPPVKNEDNQGRPTGGVVLVSLLQHDSASDGSTDTQEEEQGHYPSHSALDSLCIHPSQTAPHPHCLTAELGPLWQYDFPDASEEGWTIQDGLGCAYRSQSADRTSLVQSAGKGGLLDDGGAEEGNEAGKASSVTLLVKQCDMILCEVPTAWARLAELPMLSDNPELSVSEDLHATFEAWLTCSHTVLRYATAHRRR